MYSPVFSRLVSVPEAVPGHLQPPGPRVRPGRKEAKDQASAADHQEEQSLQHPQLKKVTNSRTAFTPRVLLVTKLYFCCFFKGVLH